MKRLILLTLLVGLSCGGGNKRPAGFDVPSVDCTRQAYQHCRTARVDGNSACLSYWLPRYCDDVDR